MLNYCIFLILWSILVLLSVAWVLAIRLSKAFQHAPPQPPIASAQLTDPAPTGHVLSYAPPPVKQSALLKRPWLAGIGALLQALLLLGIPSFLPILAWSTLRMLRPLGITALVVSMLALLSACVIVGRGLRKTGDIPAAASWPKRRLRILSFCGIPILILALVILDLGTKHRMQQVRNAMDVQSQSLYIPVPIGVSNAADLYQQAFPSLPSQPTWRSRDSDDEPPATAPPALSPELEKVVSTLHEAAQLPVVDWGIAPESYSITTLLPHLSQLRQSVILLRLHAAREAQAGRISSAISDIHVTRAIARHTGQGYVLVEGLVAIGIDQLSYDSTQDILPFVSDEQTLDQLIVQPDDWHQRLRIRMFRGEQACGLRMMIDAYDGKATGLLPGASPIATAPLRWARAFLADADISNSRGLYDEMIAIAEKDSTQALPQIRRFDAQFWVRRHEAGLLPSILVPSATRAIQKSIEAEFMAQLNNTAIAARRYYLRTGHLPATLNDLLSAKILNEIPTDPFSGKPILLKAEKDQIIIYSVGPDGRDNGGNYITSYNKDTTFRLGLKPLWEIDAEAAQADQANTAQELPPFPISTPTSRPK